MTDAERQALTDDAGRLRAVAAQHEARADAAAALAGGDEDAAWTLRAEAMSLVAMALATEDPDAALTLRRDADLAFERAEAIEAEPTHRARAALCLSEADALEAAAGEAA